MWENWKWQEQNSITDVSEYIGKDIDFQFNMKITPYYASLFDKKNCDDPIRKQAVPDIREKENLKSEYLKKYNINIYDSLGEIADSPVKHLVHRYPDRVMIESTNNCFMYCRFCTRKRITCIERRKNDLEAAYEYIRNHKEIRDVLISGGDPLTLEDNELEEILSTLRKIQHVEIIRIGTRAIVVNPMRITDELVDTLKKYKPLWINTHFNHPNELTEQAENACAKLSDAGIPLGNQSVLLRGVNDNVETMKELCLKLVKNRVRPYYLYQCDINVGNEHFRTKVNKGMEIIDALRQNITGFAIPLFVIDAPNGGGKVPIITNNIVDYNKEYVSFLNSKGEKCVYPETKEEALNE